MSERSYHGATSSSCIHTGANIEYAHVDFCVQLLSVKGLLLIQLYIVNWEDIPRNTKDYIECLGTGYNFGRSRPDTAERREMVSFWHCRAEWNGLVPAPQSGEGWSRPDTSSGSNGYGLAVHGTAIPSFR